MSLRRARSPFRDDTGPDNPHQRVEPMPAPELTGRQGRDGEYRGQGVGQDMQIGDPQVVVVMVMAVTVTMIVSVPLTGLQQEGADQVDGQPQDRDADGLIETNLRA